MKNIDQLYQEHLENPYVDRPLSRAIFEKLYTRLEDVEARALEAINRERWALHDALDHQSQKLCAALGY